MKYGHFDDKRREYVITNPEDPGQVGQLRRHDEASAASSITPAAR